MAKRPRPLVSVVTTAYNAADYLRAAMESALAQTYRPLEIVVVDDGSTDHTREVCASFGKAIRYFYQPHDDTFGSTAHIRAIRESRGDYLAFLDHDDRWFPTKIERQVHALEALPEVGLAFTSFQEIDHRGSVLGRPLPGGPSGHVFHSLLRANSYCSSSAMARRSALTEAGVHEPTLVGDWDQWLRISRRFPVVVLDDCLTQFRVHSSSFVRDKKRILGGIKQIMALNKDRLHENCAECVIALRNGIAWMHAMDARQRDLDAYHEMKQQGRYLRASRFLWRVVRASPPHLFRPRRLLMAIKTLVGPLRFH